jgi:hypothetical protein
MFALENVPLFQARNKRPGLTGRFIEVSSFVRARYGASTETTMSGCGFA